MESAIFRQAKFGYKALYYINSYLHANTVHLREIKVSTADDRLYQNKKMGHQIYLRKINSNL